MIVLFFMLSLLILLFIITLLTKIKIKINKCEFKELDKILKIFLRKDKESYFEIINYVSIDIVLLIYILNIPIYKLTLNNEKLKDIIQKNNNKKQRNKNNNKKNKIIKKYIKDNVVNNIKIENFRIKLELGVGNAEVTALVVTIINIVIALIIINLFLDKSSIEYCEKNYKYTIIPIYNNDSSIYFLFNSNIELSLKILNLIKEIIKNIKNINTNNKNKPLVNNN